MSASPGEIRRGVEARQRVVQLEALLRECGHTFNCIRNQPTTTIKGERIHTYGLAVQIEEALRT